MSAPSNVWSCEKCGRANAPFTVTCASCGGPAVVAPIEIDVPKPADVPKHFFQEPGAWLTFLPELPIAAFLVLATPVWATTLMLHGQVAEGIFLLVGVGPLSYTAYLGVSSNQKWLTYLSIVGILAIGYMVMTST